MKDGKYTTIINYLAKELQIPIKSRTQKWIDTCLLGMWGNKRVKCLGRSDKIFEILNSIYEKIRIRTCQLQVQYSKQSATQFRLF